MATEGDWKPHWTGDTCPRCGKVCEQLIVVDAEGHELVQGERCRPCAWEIRFDHDE